MSKRRIDIDRIGNIIGPRPAKAGYLR